MKKLLLVLMVVAMASFLLVGCTPATTTPVDDDPVVVSEEITATIAVATETPADADGKVYVKGGAREITTTFSEEVENPLVKVGTVVVPVFTLDNLVFKGTGTFVGPCEAVLITVGGVCADLCAAKSVVVDSVAPVVELEAKAAECDCEDSYALTITSEQVVCDGCVVDPGCCADACSGLASWNVKIYDADPWKVPSVDPCDPPDCDPCCSDDPCIEPIAEEDGTACPITITTECIAPEQVWDSVAKEFVTITYFDKKYWVIATLTDNVGNKTIYNGQVNPWDYKPMNYVYNFVEIYHEAYMPDYPNCWCYAEDYYDANSILGDCDGFPATECWDEPLEDCPVVTVNGLVEPDIIVIEGQPATVTIDYTLAVKPVGKVHAYVGPGFKGLPDSVLENELPLVVTADPYIYEANVVFSEVGDRIIYVMDGCDDCTECTYNMTVVSADVCPVVEFLGDPYVLDGVPIYGLTNIDFTVTFANRIEKELVDVYVGIPGLAPFGMPFEISLLSLEVPMVTTDEITYNGSVPLGDLKVYIINWLNHYFGNDDPYGPGWIDPEEPWAEIPELELAMNALGCIPVEIYVLAGDPCCIQTCEYPFTVDPIGPYASLEVTVETCDFAPDPCIDPGACGPCSYPGHKIVVSTLEQGTCDEIGCCGDMCSGVASWTGYICACNNNPFDDCCLFDAADCENNDCVELGGPWTGTGCDVKFETLCVNDFAYPFDDSQPFAEVWGSNWYLYVEMVDNAGNVTEYKAEMTFDTGSWVPNIEPLCEDAEDDTFGSIVCLPEANNID